MPAYRFAHHDNVPASPPENGTTALLEKAFGDEPLTREEKDRIAEVLYGLFGSQSVVYKLSGWAWDMRGAQQIRRILAYVEHYGWQEFYAPDKTSLRKAHPMKLREIVYIPRKGARKTSRA